MKPLGSKADELALLRRLADAVDDACEDTPHARWGDASGMGADGSPSKHIDRKTEAAVLECLEAEDIPLNLLSEECGFIDRGAGRMLVLDPIDGTTNAVKGIPFYCTSLAIGTSTMGDVTTGLVRNLCTGQDFTATRGGGAFLDGQPVKAIEFNPGEAVVAPVLGRSAHPAALAIAARPVNIRGLGAAALEMSLIARGALDVYIQPTPVLRVIDIAASTLILREAGGFVLGGDGTDLMMPLDLAARVPMFATGDRKALDFLGVYE